MDSCGRQHCWGISCGTNLFCVQRLASSQLRLPLTVVTKPRHRNVYESREYICSLHYLHYPKEAHTTSVLDSSSTGEHHNPRNLLRITNSVRHVYCGGSSHRAETVTLALLDTTASNLWQHILNTYAPLLQYICSTSAMLPMREHCSDTSATLLQNLWAALFDVLRIYMMSNNSARATMCATRKMKQAQGKLHCGAQAGCTAAPQPE